MIALWALFASLAAADLAELPAFLKETSLTLFPALKDISIAIYHDPEVGLDERHAHDRVVRHFSSFDDWQVVPHAFGMETSFEMTFEHRPANFSGNLKTIGFLAEYDALVGVGHACGHNHIVLNGMATALFTSKALQKYDIPGRIKLIGTPDEENAAGKYVLNQKKAFDSADIWLMAHPTSKSAIQPMNARLNFFATFEGGTHQQAVKKAYEALGTVSTLGKLPGTASTVATIENVGVYATNVVQSLISLGVSGISKAEMDETVSYLLNSSYPGVRYVTFEDKDGVAVNITGPGGHGSEASRGPLSLSVEVFRNLSSDTTREFYLPGNTTTKELDITIDMRSRYTTDLPAVAAKVSDAIKGLTSSVSHDVKYPSLELVPYIPDSFLEIISSKDYGLNDWNITDFAPASTDASWLENPTLDENHKLIGVDKVVFHANYNICSKGGICAFNHEPKFAEVAGTDFSYAQTEIVARAEAHMAVELLADDAKYKNATAIMNK